ncbi:MAG TPA: oligoendopeptidase F, partial [Desulfosporosinus sp.]|nr:oligoendopeptidase F [Desulfosporosinus sp.]
MGQQKLKSRAEIPEATKWHLEDVFSDNDQWEAEFAQIEKLLGDGNKFEGHLADNADTLIGCFEWMDDLSMRMGEVYAYARMRRDEDNRDAHYQALTDRAGALAVKVSSAASYVVPELLAMPEGRLEEFRTTSSKMGIYEHALDDILRKKKHILSSTEERLLAEVSELAEAPGAIFSMANNADLKFPSIIDESGKSVELTKGNFIQFMESHDQRVRKEAFETLYHTYDKQRNTWAATLNSSVKSDIFFAKARHYPSALEGSLDDDRVPLQVYDSLI